MIDLSDIDEAEPFQLFKEAYNKAEKHGQLNIDAASISSFNKKLNEVSARYVNLKFFKGEKIFFFSNYNSRKNKDFDTHDQAALNIFWASINFQARILVKIKKAKANISDKHFSKRNIEKNALAISSNQSNVISDYSQVKHKYEKVLLNLRKQKTLKRPKYWGGYELSPYSFEIWNGHKNRLNKRSLYTKKSNKWFLEILEP